MKTTFNFICAWLLASGAARAEAPAGAADLQRLAALADYVAADYPGAVRGGQIIAPDEYAEQRGLVAEARRLTSRLPPPRGQDGAALTADVARLQAALDARADEATVAAACRALHKRLIDDYGLVLTPLAAPSQPRARALYTIACATCHGADGRAATDKARELKPPPLSFLDDERMARISPALAFHALTFGVLNTGMAAFDTVPASDRWSLAFHVVALRHQSRSVDAARARATVQAAGLAPTASRLAELSDAQLEDLLRPTTSDAAARVEAIAYLRVQASFAAAPGGAFAVARRQLAEVAQAADGDRERLRGLAIAAYLEGIEPHEAMLRARDRGMADSIERSFGDLRRIIGEGGDGGGDAEAIRRQVGRTLLLIDRADELATGGASVPFFAALAIALREGFELSLLIAALLAFVRKSGHGDQARWVHLGWLAAVPAGVVTWFVVGAALAGAQRELTEGVLTLVAAGMLLFVSHFVLGRLESRKWLKFLERRTVAAAGRAVPWPLVAVAFVAAYREAIEIVLFFRALALGAPGHASAVALGALAGAAILAALVFGMAQLGRRLNPRPVMQASSVLLTALAVSLVGQGIHALQEGGYLRLTPLAAPNLPSLGLYATWQGLAVQAMVLLLVLVPWWLERRRAGVAKLA